MRATVSKIKIIITLLSILIILAALSWHYFLEPWGFYSNLPVQERMLRTETVAAAEKYLGFRESDGSHKTIVDLYNSHEPLAVGYVVQYSDSWCATFVSTVAIEQDLTDIIPTECGCERQISLWQDRNRWIEYDAYVPQPGDLIYYDWEDNGIGDCSGWSDHVGMVVGIKWPFIKVIEGNKDDMVAYRIIHVNAATIRGYAIPDYADKTKENAQK